MPVHVPVVAVSVCVSTVEPVTAGATVFSGGRFGVMTTDAAEDAATAPVPPQPTAEPSAAPPVQSLPFQSLPRQSQHNEEQS